MSIGLRAGLLVAAACAMAVASGCVSTGRPTKKEDAAAYNVQLGFAYMERGNLSVAKEKLDRALEQQPNSAAVHSALGLLHERLNEPAKADEFYRTAARLAPENPDFINNYAVYLCKQGRTEEGVRRFLEAASNRMYRTPEVAYTNAGVCQRAAKRDDEALANFRRALDIRPNFAEAAYQIGQLDFEKGRFPEARTQIDGYLSSFDATPDLLLLGVRVAHAQGDRLAQERYARRLRVDFPDSQQVRALSDLNRNNPG